MSLSGAASRQRAERALPAEGASQVKEEGEAAAMDCAEDADTALGLLPGEEVADETWQRLKRRRFLPHAATSHNDFQTFFDDLNVRRVEFQQSPADEMDRSDTILSLVQSEMKIVESESMGQSDYMRRFLTAMKALLFVRSVDLYFREHAMLLWIIEGHASIRFHKGDCFMLHPSGAFQQYRGVPPDSGRVHQFLMRLEGAGLNILPYVSQRMIMFESAGLYNYITALFSCCPQDFFDDFPKAWPGAGQVC